MSLLKLKSLWYPIGTSVQESQLLWNSLQDYFRATTIYWNTFVTFHKVVCARCGTNCIDSWYLSSSSLFILTRVPTHKKYRILCYPLRSNGGWLPIRCAYFILFLYPTWTGSWWIVFLPLFEGFLSEHKKLKKKWKIKLFTCWIYNISEFASIFLGYWNGCKHSLHLVIARNTWLELKLSCNMQNEFLISALCH